MIEDENLIVFTVPMLSLVTPAGIIRTLAPRYAAKIRDIYQAPNIAVRKTGRILKTRLNPVEYVVYNEYTNYGNLIEK